MTPKSYLLYFKNTPYVPISHILDDLFRSAMMPSGFGFLLPKIHSFLAFHMWYSGRLILPWLTCTKMRGNHSSSDDKLPNSSLSPSQLVFQECQISVKILSQMEAEKVHSKKRCLCDLSTLWCGTQRWTTNKTLGKVSILCREPTPGPQHTSHIIEAYLGIPCLNETMEARCTLVKEFLWASQAVLTENMLLWAGNQIIESSTKELGSDFWEP